MGDSEKIQKQAELGYGVIAEIPDGAIPPSRTVSFVVRVIHSGQFELPNDSQLISAIYWISSSEVFLKEVPFNIPHFAVIRSEEQCSKFRFIIAETSQSELPYKFRERGGLFNPHTQYATIKLKQLNSMLFGAVGPKDTELYFSALKFYKPIPGTSKVEFIFVVVCQSYEIIQVVYNHYSSG